MEKYETAQSTPRISSVPVCSHQILELTRTKFAFYNEVHRKLEAGGISMIVSILAVHQNNAGEISIKPCDLKR